MEDYYALDKMSNSWLGYYLISPQYYNYKKNNRDEEEESRFLLLGKVIHKYVLENDTFFKEYIVEPENKPRNKQQKQFCVSVVSGNDPETAYSLSYSKGSKDKAIELHLQLKEYIDFLSSKKDESPIPQSMLNSAINIKRAIELNKAANVIINDYQETEFTETETHNEWERLFYYSDIDFKSKLDKLKIDHDNKIVTISDLKTYTLKSMYENKMHRLKYKIKEGHMYRQLFVYKTAVYDYLQSIVDDPDEYTFEYKIVFTSTNYFNYVDVVNIDPSFIDIEGKNEADEIIKNYKVNLSYDNFDNDYYYFEGNGEYNFMKENVQ